MSPYKDYDGSWRIAGYEDCKFSTEDDAQTACDLALYYFMDRIAKDAAQESRYRRAAKRAQTSEVA